jgi:hypothetical protein
VTAHKSWWCAAFALFALAACRAEKPQTLVRSAELGIFFGGQVQEREQIPFQLDRAKQTQGFRIDFSEPLSREIKVDWEIDRPAPPRLRTRKRDDPERIVEIGGATARVGQSRFDQPIAFRPGEALGSWKVLVRVDGQTVIDRSLVIYDPAIRRADDAGAAAR